MYTKKRSKGPYSIFTFVEVFKNYLIMGGIVYSNASCSTYGKNQKHVNLLCAEKEWFTDDTGHVCVTMRDE